MKNKKINNHFNPVKCFLSAFFAIFLLAGSHCNGCDNADVELAQNYKLIVDLRACNASYQDQLSLSGNIFSAVKNIGCFEDEDKKAAEALLQDLKKKMDTFATSYTEKSIEGERAKIIETAQNAEAEFRTVANQYQQLQEYLAYCRVNHIMAGNSKGDVLEKGSPEDQDKLYLHVLGDVFGKKSGLEGFQEGQILSHRTNVLKVIQGQLQGRVFIKDQAQTRPCQDKVAVIPKGRMPYPDLSQDLLNKLIKQSESAEYLMNVFHGNLSLLPSGIRNLGEIGALQTVLKEQLEDLQPGESLFLPAGWSQHAVFYQITKEKKNDNKPLTYTFRIFNSGDGINTYHASTSAGYKTQYFPFVEVKEISFQSITGLVFLKSLKEIAAPTAYNTKPQDFYEKLLTQLDGKNQQIPYGADVFEDPQHAGTCTYFATPWILSSSVAQFWDEDKAQSEFIPDQIEFFINLKTLKDYADNHEKQRGGMAGMDNTRMNLMKKGVVYFSERAMSGRDSFAIDEGTLASAAMRVEIISRKIKEAEKAIQKKMASDTPQFDTSNLKKKPLPKLKTPIQKSYLISASRSAVFGKTLDLSFNWQTPTDNDNQLIKDLRIFYGRLDHAVKENYFILAIDAIQKIALNLSLEEKFWKNTSEDQATQIIHELSMLDKLYLYALLKAVKEGQRPEKQVSTVELLTSIKFLTVSDLLAQKLPYHIPSMYQKLIGEYLYGDTSIFETEDPRWQWQISLLRHYYRKQKNTHQKDFFGFDKYPAGAATERRIYFDPDAVDIMGDSEKHWSKNIIWPDVEWATKTVKKQPGYTNWLGEEIRGNAGRDSIPPWTFQCEAPSSILSATCAPQLDPVKRVDFPSTGEDILVRRLVMNLLTKNSQSGVLFQKSLPQAFYDLRVASVVIDYLLTSTLVANFDPDFSKGIRVNKADSGINMAQVDARLQCTCDGTESYTEDEEYFADENYQQEHWNPNKKAYDYSTETRRVRRTRQITKNRTATKPGKVIRKTMFRYSDLEYNIFGKDDDKPTPKSYYKERETKEQASRAFIFTSPYIHLKNAAIPLQKYETDEENPKWQYKEVLKLFNIGLTDDGELSDPATAPTRRRYQPNLLILKSPKEEGVPGLSLERMRGLLGLSGFKEQQLIQTLAYFTKYTERLSQPEYQRMFEKLMMEPSLILDQLTVSERQSAIFTQKLASFCQERFQSFRRFGDYRGMAFILRMNQLFVNEVTFASTLKEGKVPQNSIAQFLDTPEALFGLIQKLTKQQQDEKSFLYQNLANAFFYKTDLSHHDIELLLLSVIESNTFSLSKKFDDSFGSIETKNVLMKHAGRIREALVSDVLPDSVSDDGKKILDFIVQYAQPDLRGQSDWKIANTGPAVIFQSLFQHPAADIQINIIDGRIFDSGKSRVPFPINEKDYEEIFGDSKPPEYATEISYGQYQWIIDGMRVRAQRQDASTWVVQREVFENSWYQYMRPTEVQQLKANKVIFTGYDYWKSVNKINGKWQFRVLDSKTKEEKYTLVFEDSAPGELIPEIKRLSDGAVLIDVDDQSSYRIFERIEDWRYVYIWAVQDSRGKPAVKEVVLPRLGLRFSELNSAGQEPRLTCGNAKDYTVSREQFSVALGEPLNYVMCSKNPSDEKPLAIMSLAKPVQIERANSLLAKFAMEFSSNPNDNSVTYFSYEMDPLRIDGFAATTSNAARYYLALRYLWQQQYRLASQQIQSILSSSQALKKREIEILKWMAIGNDLDHDPRAYAVRLRAEFELASNLEHYHGRFVPELDVETKSLGDLYIKYLSKVERVDRGLLGLHQEKRIARRLMRAAVASIEELKKQQHIPETAEKIEKVQKQQKMIASRVLAIEAELKNEQFEADLNAVNPRELALVQSASLMSEPNALEQLEEMFLNTPHVSPPMAAPHALDAASMVTSNNFALLYRIMSGDNFDHDKALALFKSVLGNDDGFNKLTKEKLRQEFILLIRMAVLVDKEKQERDPFKEQRKNARLLAAVAESKKKGLSLKTDNNIRNDFVQVNENNKKVKQLEVQIKAANNAGYQAYQAEQKLAAPKEYQNGKLNPTYEDEMNYYRKEKKRLEELVRVRWDDLNRLEAEREALDQASQKIRDNLRQYFNDVQNADTRQHRIIETPINPGKVKFAGLKQTLNQGASKDILDAQIPLTEIVKSDPLATPILTEDFFTTLQVISEQALSSAQQKNIDDDAASLNNVLRVDGMAPDVETAVGSLREKVLNRAVDIKEKSKFYKIKDWTALQNISLRLRGKDGVYSHILKIPEAEKKQKELQDKILKLGRKYADKLDGGAYAKLHHLADLGKQNDINDLIYLLIKRNLVVYYEQSSGAHDLEELGELYKNLINYLMLTTYIKHAERFADSVDAVVKKHSAGLSESSDEFQQLLENMVGTGREIRRYKIDDHVEYLIFEHFMTILLRENQVAALNELKINNGKIENERALGGVLEMIMGAGKTSVLLPLLSALDTSGESLNMIILPEALVASMSEQLAYQLGTAFARGVDVLLISRQRYLREPDLRLLCNGLVRARLENRTIITTNGAVQSLFLSFVDRLSRYEKDRNQVSGEIEAFIRIFRFLRQYGRLTIDEVDLALDILQSHQFSIGDSISLIKDKDKFLQTLPATVLSFYHLIATTPKLYEQVDLPFLYYSRGKGALTASSYQKLKVSLVDEILNAKPFFFGFKDLNALLRDFVTVKVNADLVKNYLLQGTMQNRETLLAKIDASARNSEQANRLKDIITTLYDELNVVFEMSATKKLGVHYGHLPKPVRKEEESDENFKSRQQVYLTSRYIAIPYHSGEPMENSRFGTPLEALNYTIQMMLEQRNYRDIVEDEIEALKRLAEQGSASKILKGRFEERFENLVGKNFNYSIGAIGPKQIDDISKNIGAKDKIESQFDLVSRYVAPQVTVYPMQLQTNAQVYEALFKHIQGFTGTLWSADTFPKIFRKPLLSNTAEKTFLILWQDYLDQKKHNSGLESFKALKSNSLQGPQLLGSLVEQIYADWKQPGSFMDEAGVFRAFDNEKVAKAILENPNVKAKGVLGVIFYDAEDNIKILDSSGVTDLASAHVPLRNRIAFWDKKHTTGSDLKLRADMEAKVAVDHHTSSRGLQQTVWRLRGLGTGQRIVQYFALEDDMDIIKKRLTDEWKIKKGGGFDLGDLILYVVVNQEIRLGDLRFRAVKQKMKNVVVSRLLDGIFGLNSVNAPVDIPAATTLYRSARKLFETGLEKEKLYLTMGKPRHEVSVSIALNAEKKRILETDYVKRLNRGGLSGDEAYGQIAEAIEKLIKEEEPKLPRLILMSSFENDLEIEIELEVETEQEEEEETEKEEEPYKIDANHKAHTVLPWSLNDSNRVFKEQFFTPVPVNKLGTNPNLWLTQLQPLVSLPDALVYKEQKFLSHAFDRNILLSFNLVPIHHRNIYTHDSHYEFEFFSVYHKYPGDVLIIEDKKSGDIRLVLLDGNDVTQWSQFFTRDVQNAGSMSGRDLRLGLYNINLTNKGLYQDGAEEMDESVLKTNPQFLKLIVEVKFFAGTLHYSKEEEPYLQKFLSGPSTNLEERHNYTKKMLDIFRGEILKLRHDSTLMFRGSDIEATFEALLGELD